MTKGSLAVHLPNTVHRCCMHGPVATQDGQLRKISKVMHLCMW